MRRRTLFRKDRTSRKTRLRRLLSCLCPKIWRQIFAGIAVLDARDVFGRSGCDDAPAGVAAFGTEIDDVICGFDHFEIMFNHDYSIALIDEGMQHF